MGSSQNLQIPTMSHRSPAYDQQDWILRKRNRKVNSRLKATKDTKPVSVAHLLYIKGESHWRPPLMWFAVWRPQQPNSFPSHEGARSSSSHGTRPTQEAFPHVWHSLGSRGRGKETHHLQYLHRARSTSQARNKGTVRKTLGWLTALNSLK